MFEFLFTPQMIAGFQSILTFTSILYMITGTALGIIIGAIPGLSSSIGVIVLLPLTFYMETIHALVFLCSIYVSVIYGGSLTAILLNTPGTSESTATTFDGYQMTLQGKASEAIGLAIGSSLIGGLISYVILLYAMAPVAWFAIKFGPSEMFLVSLLGITIIASLREKTMSKTLLSGILGLLLGTIGISSKGDWRSTFGLIYLADGMPFLPPLIGLFAITEVFCLAERNFVVSKGKEGSQSVLKIMKGIVKVFKYPLTILRSSLMGTVIGAIPGAGATIAAFVGYNEAKRSSKHPEKYGTGYPDGIVAAEVANNASTGGALMTTMTLGIPGSTTCAVIIAAFMLHGITPGPALLRDQSTIVYGLIMALFVSQIFMVGMTIIAGISFAKLLVLPTYILVPFITLFCVIGSFSFRNATFDIYLTFIFGIIGWLMRKYDYSPVALILGILLGPIADSELIRIYTQFGNEFYLAFITRPISLVLSILLVLSIIRPYLQNMFLLRKKNKK